MGGTQKPQDLVIGALGTDYLGRVRILLEGATAVLKGNIVRVTSLTFGARGEPRTGAITRSDHATQKGMLFIAAHDAQVGRQVTCVSWLPFQMVTTGAAIHDPVYLGANGLPTLVDPTGGLVIGTVVFVGTIAAGGCIALQVASAPLGN